MEAGDVAIIGMQSLDPDMIVMLALAELPGGASIYITDNAWTGYELKSNEGVKKVRPQESETNELSFSASTLETPILTCLTGL